MLMEPTSDVARSERLFTPYDSSDREFTEQDWDRLWRRFLPCLAESISPAELEFLRGAPIVRRAELVRRHMQLGHAPAWRFANIFEAVACEMEHAFEPAPAKQPTRARPGSLEKIAVLSARADAGEELYHPLDEAIPLWTLELERSIG
jgi:hypothetical protein